MANICLIEDEKDLNKILKIYIEKEGHNVVCYYNMIEAITLIEKNINFDIWILDIMLPDGNGIEILKKIKQKNENTPVILISARCDSIDRVLGFEVGCDDYISKPFLPAELIHRISKLLKIYKIKNENNNILKFSCYTIDKNKRIISIDDKKIDLTTREYDIILYFISNPSVAISRNTLLEKIWGSECYYYDRVVDNYIKNIRKKLPCINIETIYGFGYRFNL